MKKLILWAGTTIVALLTLASPTMSQDAWDADKNVPPPTSNLKARPQPTEIKPFTFIFYRVCEPQQGATRYVAKWSFDILSQYGSVGFDHIESDSLVILKLRSNDRSRHKAQIWFPEKPFTLLVILGQDTAVFTLDLDSGLCTYVDTSKLLRIESPQEIPAGLVWVQFMDRNNDQARDFIDQATQRFGSAVEQIVLKKGFYACLASPRVDITNIGRRKALNETAIGFLVCLRVTDSSQANAISQWIWEHQREEFKRASNHYELKGM